MNGLGWNLGRITTPMRGLELVKFSWPPDDVPSLENKASPGMWVDRDLMTRILDIFDLFNKKEISPEQYDDMSRAWLRAMSFHRTPGTQLRRHGDFLTVEQGLKAVEMENGNDPQCKEADNDAEACQICFTNEPMELSSEPQTTDGSLRHVLCRACFRNLLRSHLAKGALPYYEEHYVQASEIVVYANLDLVALWRARHVESCYLASLWVVCSNTACKMRIPEIDMRYETEFNHHGVAICPRCNHTTCTTCEQPREETETKMTRHTGKRCGQQNWETIFKAWADLDEALFNCCPGCGTIVEKTEGCMHLHCVACRVDWCEICSRFWESCTCKVYDDPKARVPMILRSGVRPGLNPESRARGMETFIEYFRYHRKPMRERARPIAEHWGVISNISMWHKSQRPVRDYFCKKVLPRLEWPDPSRPLLTQNLRGWRWNTRISSMVACYEMETYALAPSQGLITDTPGLIEVFDRAEAILEELGHPTFRGVHEEPPWWPMPKICFFRYGSFEFFLRQSEEGMKVMEEIATLFREKNAQVTRGLNEGRSLAQLDPFEVTGEVLHILY